MNSWEWIPAYGNQEKLLDEYYIFRATDDDGDCKMVKGYLNDKNILSFCYFPDEVLKIDWHKAIDFMWAGHIARIHFRLMTTKEKALYQLEIL